MTKISETEGNGSNEESPESSSSRVIAVIGKTTELHHAANPTQSGQTSGERAEVNASDLPEPIGSDLGDDDAIPCDQGDSS